MPLPTPIATTLVSIFLASLLIFVLIPLIINYWRLSRSDIESTRKARANPQETLGLLAGLIVGDILIYLIGTRIFPVPTFILYPVIVGIDLFFLFFVLDSVIVDWITRRRIRVLEQNVSQK